ncbi:MAG: acetylglutamate kinase [Oscillospiraceae bacterium]|nr:acetylglutamate kinase [Oscillospiraceae bacterium]
MDLISHMRLVWSQHVYWTRMLLISIAERLKDLDAVTARLMQNPGDIAKIFEDYYGPDTAKAIEQLLTEHLQIGAELITALRDGKAGQAEELNERWYLNADKMAGAFSGISPYYREEEMREMLYRHLDLTKQEVAKRLSGDYPADIKAFDLVEREAIMMADAFSSGMIRQFPQMFS